MVNATKHILEPKAKGAPSLKGGARSGDRLEASSSHTILSALCVGMRPVAPHPEGVWNRAAENLFQFATKRFFSHNHHCSFRDSKYSGIVLPLLFCFVLDF